MRKMTGLGKIVAIDTAVHTYKNNVEHTGLFFYLTL
jgi:hypothetical protein